MKFSKLLILKVFFIFISSQVLFNVSKAKGAEEIKIIYSIFSRTIKVNSLETFAKEGNSTKKLKRIPRLINEPYTKEMGIKIAKKVTEKGVVRLVKIAAGANI